jgi:hypothetical protein
MNMQRTLLLTLATTMCLLWGSCSPTQIAGGTDTETGGPTVTGSIRTSGNIPAPHTVVALIPTNYDPARDASLSDSLTDTTDADGTYSVHVAKKGTYNIQAIELASRNRLLIFGLNCSDNAVIAPLGTLSIPGAIRISLSDSIDKVNGYCYIPGTNLYARVQEKTDFIVIDSVPTGVIPKILYASFNSSHSSVMGFNITINSGDTTNTNNPTWKYSRRIFLNTSASGAAVSGNVAQFPVLIRLTANNFIFSQALAGGADIRLTKPDNTPIPFQIQRWDPVAKIAEVWVKIDTIYGNDSTHFFIMYWGDSTGGLTISQSNGTAVFDTTDGFQGVWHLDDAVGNPISDATANQFLGVSPDSGKPQVGEGVIGNCRNFDGSKDFISMPSTASGKLNFAEDGIFSISAWVFVDTIDSTSSDFMYQTIASKGYKQYFLQLTSFPSYKPLWEFSNFREADKWCKSTLSATEKQWMLLTGVVQGGSQYLYYNGELVDSTMTKYQQVASRDASEDFTIGRFFKQATFPVNGFCYFKGKIDEVSVSNMARSSDWIRLCYMNQRIDDKLVQFK